MRKRLSTYPAWILTAAVLAVLSGLTGCGKKDQDAPTNDPSYYAGKDFRQNASKPKTKGGD